MNAFNRPEMAFPWDAHLNQCGMTLRDYMAAKAMQGIMASGRWDVVGANIITSEAYEIADAMIKAREAS